MYSVEFLLFIVLEQKGGTYSLNKSAWIYEGNSNLKLWTGSEQVEISNFSNTHPTTYSELTKALEHL